MATRRYNVGRDATGNKDVTEAVGAAIASGLVQVTVDLAVTAEKREVIRALHVISEYIRTDDWPPA